MLGTSVAITARVYVFLGVFKWENLPTVLEVGTYDDNTLQFFFPQLRNLLFENRFRGIPATRAPLLILHAVLMEDFLALDTLNKIFYGEIHVVADWATQIRIYGLLH